MHTASLSGCVVQTRGRGIGGFFWKRRGWRWDRSVMGVATL